MNNDPNQKQDPLDKAFAAGAKKFGGAQGQKIAGNRATSEKIVCFHYWRGYDTCWACVAC